MEACTFTWTSQSDFKNKWLTNSLYSIGEKAMKMNKWLTNSLYSIREKAMKVTTDKAGIEPTYTFTGDSSYKWKEFTWGEKTN